MRAVLRTPEQTPEGGFQALADTYLQAVAEAGPHCNDVAAALSGFDDGKALLALSRSGYESLFREMPSWGSSLDPQLETALSVAIFGAVEALALATASGRLNVNNARKALSVMARRISLHCEEPQEGGSDQRGLRVLRQTVAADAE